MDKVIPGEAFTFSFERAIEARKDIELRLEAQQERLNRISNKVELNDHPIINMLLSVSHDSEELKRLSKALERVAEIMPIIDELQAHKAMIDLALKNPDMLKAMFGDFGSEVETFLTSIDTIEG